MSSPLHFTFHSRFVHPDLCVRLIPIFLQEEGEGDGGEDAAADADADDDGGAVMSDPDDEIMSDLDETPEEEAIKAQA